MCMWRFRGVLIAPGIYRLCAAEHSVLTCVAAQRLVAASSATFMLVDVHLEQYEAREKWGTRLGRGPRIFFATFFARLHWFANVFPAVSRGVVQLGRGREGREASPC